MEMPLNVMITLFIVIAVGALLLIFAQGRILTAENALKKFDPNDPDQKDRILEVDTINSGQIAFAIKECFKEFFGKSFEDEYCTIFRASAPYDLDETEKTAIYAELKNYPDLFDSDDDGQVQDTELDSFVSIQPPINSSIFFVKWNGQETLVEVTS